MLLVALEEVAGEHLHDFHVHLRRRGRRDPVRGIRRSAVVPLRLKAIGAHGRGGGCAGGAIHAALVPRTVAAVLASGLVADVALISLSPQRRLGAVALRGSRARRQRPCDGHALAAVARVEVWPRSNPIDRIRQGVAIGRVVVCREGRVGNAFVEAIERGVAVEDRLLQADRPHPAMLASLVIGAIRQEGREMLGHPVGL
mmetsp:Transcript_87892/g.253527  ORF Transcript_87892/g.253527 Transcript_87892/m.253527 type:complete len:200 (-) Transcript_87892:2515-3114(-)